MSKQLGFHVDLERCIGCHSCAVAYKQWNNVGVGPRWRRVTMVEGGVYPKPFRYTVSLSCNHCANLACLPACPVPDAIVKREEDGVIIID
ncbi:MAG: hypothetical protein GY805_22690 [Chloroflexi bacterium]|nr:hypothetical protein [Chloroflexota bacterium]